MWVFSKNNMSSLKPQSSSPLWAQLLITLMFIAVVVAFLGGEYIRVTETPRRLAHAEEMVQSQLAIVAVTTLDAVAVKNLPVLKTAVAGMASVLKDVQIIEVIDAENKTLIHWRRPGLSKAADEDGLITLVQGVRFEGESIGAFRVGWDATATHAEVAKKINEVRKNIILFMLVTAIAILIWMHQLVIRPVMRINQRLLSGLSKGDVLSFPWAAREFQVLAHSVKNLEDMTISKDELENEVERRKNAEIALLDARDDALAASNAKSNFLANMSHELRTPLNAIIGYSEMMEEDARESGRHEHVSDLSKVRSAGSHLLVLINEILDLSKIEAGKVELYLEAFSLEDAVKTVLSTIEPEMKKSGNTVLSEGFDAIPPMMADLTRVRQILSNLLSNAIKFTENGKIIVSAKLKKKNDIGGVEILVVDSGIGLSEEDMEDLFLPFQQADASTTRKYGGTGLGLSLCRHLCDLMEGDIWVESQAGHGSTFGVWLPLAVQTLRDTQQPVSGLKQQRIDPKSVRMLDDVQRRIKGDERRKRIATILTIDDDPNVQELMARVFQREGFRPVSAANGKMGLELARQLRPDLITLDIMMPEMDGWAVLKTLKEDPELRDIPVIMVSIVEDKPMALDVGAIDSLTKPIAWNRLIDLTRNVVRDKNDKEE